jgi:CyaY protein
VSRRLATKTRARQAAVRQVAGPRGEFTPGREAPGRRSRANLGRVARQPDARRYDGPPMDDATFDELGRAELSHIEDCFEDVDPDEVEISVSDGVLTLELRDGVRVVVNTHRAARQIWMAAVASAWKFSYDDSDGRWRTDGGAELRATLAGILRERLGLAVTL